MSAPFDVPTSFYEQEVTPAPRQVYACSACGRVMKRREGYASDMGTLCHPDDPTLRDCYHRWTVYQDDGSETEVTHG